MGILEKEARNRRRLQHVQKALLIAAVIGGIMLIGGAPSPSVLLPLGGKRNKYRFKHQVKTALSRLAQKGYIAFHEEKGMRYARITESGKKLLEYEEQKAALQLKRGKRWDKRWRIVIFDIPEIRRNVRDQLREVMRDAGFYHLQDSVWLYPHDCEDFIALLKADLKIGNAVLYLIVEKIENEKHLKEHFGLA